MPWYIYDENENIVQTCRNIREAEEYVNTNSSCETHYTISMMKIS